MPGSKVAGERVAAFVARNITAEWHETELVRGTVELDIETGNLDWRELEDAWDVRRPYQPTTKLARYYDPAGSIFSKPTVELGKSTRTVLAYARCVISKVDAANRSLAASDKVDPVKDLVKTIPFKEGCAPKRAR